MDGWIAQLGIGDFNHGFGGDDWVVRDSEGINGGPSLILSLDLADPKLNSLRTSGLKILPIVSYLNCDIWIYPQHFKIIPDLNQVYMIGRSATFTTVLEGELSFENPLERKSFFLRDMTAEELGVGDDNYWKACDSFVGGASFIRILGPPLWLQGAEKVHCFCGKEGSYVCSIGYDIANPTGFVSEKAFFVGEGALYFFICSHCSVLSVVSQGT